MAVIWTASNENEVVFPQSANIRQGIVPDSGMYIFSKYLVVWQYSKSKIHKTCYTQVNERIKHVLIIFIKYVFHFVF